nr:3'-5' exonuclease [Parabacteroides sp. FAFU027]
MGNKLTHSNITKEEINTLPVVLFEGRIFVVQSEEEANKAVAYLSKFEEIGFDTETRPAFKKGVRHQVCLLQLSTADTCFLFRLNHIGLPASVISLLTDEKVKKIGLAIKDDFVALGRRTPFIPKGQVELQHFVKQYGILDNSLQKIFALLFRQKISKSQRLTNWEADVLTEAQKKYAATDAWASLRIYQTLIQTEQEIEENLNTKPNSLTE